MKSSGRPGLTHGFYFACPWSRASVVAPQCQAICDRGVRSLMAPSCTAKSQQLTPVVLIFFRLKAPFGKWWLLVFIHFFSLLEKYQLLVYHIHLFPKNQSSKISVCVLTSEVDFLHQNRNTKTPCFRMASIFSISARKQEGCNTVLSLSQLLSDWKQSLVTLCHDSQNIFFSTFCLLKTRYTLYLRACCKLENGRTEKFLYFKELSKASTIQNVFDPIGSYLKFLDLSLESCQVFVPLKLLILHATP